LGGGVPMGTTSKKRPTHARTLGEKGVADGNFFEASDWRVHQTRGKRVISLNEAHLQTDGQGAIVRVLYRKTSRRKTLLLEKKKALKYGREKKKGQGIFLFKKGSPQESKDR